jgi:hypothetical protein
MFLEHTFEVGSFAFKHLLQLRPGFLHLLDIRLDFGQFRLVGLVLVLEDDILVGGLRLHRFDVLEGPCDLFEHLAQLLILDGCRLHLPLEMLDVALRLANRSSKRLQLLILQAALFDRLVQVRLLVLQGLVQLFDLVLRYIESIWYFALIQFVF